MVLQEAVDGRWQISMLDLKGRSWGLTVRKAGWPDVGHAREEPGSSVNGSNQPRAEMGVCGPP